MTDTALQKLVVQLLPAVAAAHTPPPPETLTPASVKQMWNDYLDEAASLAKLFEAKFTQEGKDKQLNQELIAQTL